MRLKYIDGLMGFVVGDAMGVPLEGKNRKELLKVSSVFTVSSIAALIAATVAISRIRANAPLAERSVKEKH